MSGSFFFLGSIPSKLPSKLPPIPKNCITFQISSRNRFESAGCTRSTVDRCRFFHPLAQPSRGLSAGASADEGVSVPRVGGGGGRSVTVFHAGRGRRTPKIGACARACMSVQDARRCSRYTPTSLCSPVTFAEAVFSLPPSSFSFQHRFFSPSFAPIPSNTSSLLFFFPLALFSTLLLPLSSLLATRFEDSVSRFVARNRGRERERKGVYFARVYTGRF